MIDFIIGPLRFEFMQFGVVQAILIGALCGGVGVFLVLRRLSFLADALPHCVFPGMAIALALGGEVFIGGCLAAFAAVATISRLQRQPGVNSDAAVGLVYVGVFALGVMVVSRGRNFAQNLTTLLFGSILTAGPRDIVVTLAIAGVALIVIGALFKEIAFVTFDRVAATAQGLPVGRLEFALLAVATLIVVAAAPVVGNTLVAGLLVIPAAAARLCARRLPAMIALAAGIGALSGVVGLYLSFYLNLAAGAAIVVVTSVVFFGAVFLAPHDGLVARWRRAGTASHGSA